MTTQLSSGALETIMAGGVVENPVMQILGSKKMSSGTTAERYRLLISDGKHLNSFAMLATQLNEKVETGELSDYSVVRLNRVITSMVNNAGKGQKRVLIILDITVITPGAEVGVRIGNPSPYEESGSGVSPSKVAASSTAYNPPPNPTKSYGGEPMATNGNGYSAGAGQTTATHPIISLNPYQNHWTIKARCTAKTAVKVWNNTRSEGKLFSMEFLDETADIRCTAFKDMVDKYYNLIEIGKVYYVSNGQLKAANKQFTNVKHEYEMTLTHNSIITECLDESSYIPSIVFDFVPIDKIESMEEGATVDIVAICNSAGVLSTLTAKASGKEYTKRDICLIDESKRSVLATLWGEQALQFEHADSPVIAIKGARIKTFNGGKTISLQSSSTLTMNPDIPEAHRLRGWFENEGKAVECKSMSSATFSRDTITLLDNWVALSEMKLKQLGTQDAPDYIVVKATIINTKNDRALYQACPSIGCNKKLNNLHNGMFRCEKCNREYDNFKYRLLTRFNVGDFSTNQFINCFHEQSEAILDATAEQLGEMQQSDPSRFEAAFSRINFQPYLFKLRVKMETYNDTNMLKAIVMSIQKPIDHKLYHAHLIKEIKELSGMVKPE